MPIKKIKLEELLKLCSDAKRIYSALDRPSSTGMFAMDKHNYHHLSFKKLVSHYLEEYEKLSKQKKIKLSITQLALAVKVFIQTPGICYQIGRAHV